MEIDEIYQEIDVHECPCCGGPGLLEEENGWCWYVMCLDCGAHTGQINYGSPEDRKQAAKEAAHIWNIGKVIAAGVGE